VLEGFGHFQYLAARLFRAEEHRRAHRHRAHIECLIDVGEQGLIKFVGIGE
jgi:hypothetical protein